MDDETIRRLKKLITTGKKNGYVLYDDIDNLLPEDYAGGREVDDILSDVDRAGIEILEEPRIAADERIERGDEFIQQVQDFSDDPVMVYLREVGTLPLLSSEGERELAERIQGGGRDAEIARKELVEANLRLVVFIARRYATRGIHILDLVQEGNRALLKAVYEFDPARSYRFSTYATWWVRRALSRTASRI
jgi:RNA polymerase primary sigma factor